VQAEDVGAAAPEASDGGLWVGFFINIGASCVCSSHSSHGIFSSVWMRSRFVFRVVCGLGPCSSGVWGWSLLYRFSPGFPLINRISLFLINKRQSFCLFSKKSHLFLRLQNNNGKEWIIALSLQQIKV
jgi:hypothetical protein